MSSQFAIDRREVLLNYSIPICSLFWAGETIRM